MSSERPSAKKLLERSKALAQQQGQACDTLHIIYEALSHPDAELPGTQALASTTDETKRKKWIEAIELDLRFHGKAAPSAEPTDRFRECSKAWSDAAKHHPIGLTDALILLTIIEKDGITSQMMSFAGILLSEIKPALESWLDRDVTEQDEDAEAVAEVEHLLKAVHPEKHIHPEMHNLWMRSLLNGLVESLDSEDGKIVILIGQHGSPADALDQVLAARLQTKDHLTNHLAPLKEYDKVEILSLAEVYKLGSMLDKPSPERVLEAAKRIAARNKAILLLSHIEEILRHRTPIAEKIRMALMDRGEALIIGRYIFIKQEDNQRIDLGLPNVLEIEVHSSDLERTGEFLRTYYYPEWEQAGYTFTKDAFDGLCHLAPGAWVYKQHTTLPYLAVGVGYEAMETADGGEPAIRETAQDALAELKRLHSIEWPKTSEQKRKPFEETLRKAETTIRSMIEGDAPVLQQTDKDKILLTSAHILAQLLCRNGQSEFHYPGHHPDHT